MNGSLLLVILAAVMVSFIAVAIPVVAIRREKRRQEEREILERARQERAAERQRAKQVKRLARQDQIGDRIFWFLVQAWKRAGQPEGREVLRIRHNGGSYYIQVGRNHPDPIYAKVWVSIDLNRSAGEIVFAGDSDLLGQNHLKLSATDGEDFIHPLADRLFGTVVLS